MTIEAKAVEEMTGIYDVIFFNHSFEHVHEPQASLKAARRLQATGALCVIRVPTTSSEAFELYGKDWVQLDPPRHLTIPSREGMASLAKRSGYVVERMVDDSTAFQFWGSEQYRRDIPLTAPNSYKNGLSGSIFTADQIEAFERRAQALNAKNRGDQTAFILRAVDI